MSQNALIGIIIFIILIFIVGGLLISQSISNQPAPPAVIVTPTTSQNTVTPMTTSLSPSPTQITPTGPLSVTPSAIQVQNISVSAYEYRFEPNTITVNQGQAVKITLLNEGQMNHNLTIPDFNVSTRTISSGQSDSITFTPNKTGTFIFFCSVDEHRALGLTGTLKVQ